MAEAQQQVDSRNAEFWEELCGSTLAAQLGITDASPQSLERFDAAYMGAYPYLERYLPGESERGKSLLEIGLGYGTVSQILAASGLDYNGLDIARGPVEMVRDRISRLDFDDPEERVKQGSILEAPHPDESFDHVVAIGCLHHTGDLPRAVSEVRRVLRPGGRAWVMIYNKNSFRRFKMAIGRRLRGAGDAEEEMRATYDHNAEGDAAPATAYTSVRGARELFGDFASVEVRRENFDGYQLRRLAIPRERLLGRPAHLAGLDLYITATK